MAALRSKRRAGAAPGVLLWAALLGLALATSGCVARRLAVNTLAEALAASGTTFAADEDPELIRAALPFSLKLLESLLAESPRHPGLLLASASGFAQYAYAFVQQDAEALEEEDLAAAEALRLRARRLYLRARDYGLRGLEVRHRGFGGALRADPRQAVGAAQAEDVPLLYWTAVAWAGAIALGKDSPDLLAELPLVEAMIDRALGLDEGFGEGAIHAFLITYEMSRPGGSGKPAARARQHFERALALSGGQSAGPLVAYAEAVCVQSQDVAEFESVLKRALAIDLEARPEWRLANLVGQRRARWLLQRTEQLFLCPGPVDAKESE